MFTVTATPQECVEAFQKRFEPLYGDGHLLFACHAVYPVMLSPDLLYQLWYNFRHYMDADGKPQEMAPEVVNDFIHSGLCKPLSKGLYSVEDELRVYLLERLIAREGEGSVKQLAHFLKAWQSQPEAHALRKSTRQLHDWVIGATLDPGGAAKAVTKALSENIQKGNRRENKRIYHVINSLKEHSPAFEELFQYAEKLAEQIQRQEGEDVVLPAISFEEQEGIDLVKMPLTEELRKKIGRREQGETDPEVLSRIASANASGGIEVDLSGLKLAKLPPELLELKELEVLNLENNAFTKLPKGLQHFPKLQRLNLATNQLRHLNINLLDCLELRWLDVDENDVTFIPGFIGQLKHLTHFSANYNPIRYVPGSMGSLPLQHISIANSRLESLPLGWEKLADYWEQLEREEKFVDYYGGLEEASIVFDLGTNAFGNSDPSASPARQLDYAIAYSRGYFGGLNFTGKNKIVAVVAGTNSHLSPEIPDLAGTEEESHQWVNWLNAMLPSERLEVRELIGQRACTKRNLIDTLMSAEVGEGDQLLFIFAGHSAIQALEEPLQKFYEQGKMASLVCSDSRAEESDLYGIELEAILATIQQRGATVTVITDVSHSSGLWRLPEDVRNESPSIAEGAIDPKEFFFAQGVEDLVLNNFANFVFGNEEYPASPALLHFSACEVTEAAMLSRVEGEEVGVFNKGFFSAFERMPWNITSNDLASNVNLQSRFYASKQHPNLLSLNFAPKHSVFLGAADQSVGRNDLHVSYNEHYKSWVLDAGAMHGLSNEDEKLAVLLFDEFHREADNPIYALAEVKIKRVENTCTILDSSINHLDKHLIFRAYLTGSPRHEIAIHKQQARLSIWPEKEMYGLQEYWKAHFVDNETEAEVILNSSEIHWKRANQYFQLEAPMTKGADPQREIDSILNRIAVCERLIDLNNKKDRNENEDVSCQFIRLTVEGEPQGIPLTETNSIDIDHLVGAEGLFELKNNGEEAVYVQLLFIRPDTLGVFSFLNKAVAIPAGGAIVIGPLDLNSLPGHFWFKLLSAPEPFDVSSWLQVNNV